MGKKGLGEVEEEILPKKGGVTAYTCVCIQAERGETEKQRVDFRFLNRIQKCSLAVRLQGKSPNYSMCSLIIDNRDDRNHERVSS